MARGTFKQKRGGGRSRNLTLDENGVAVSSDKPRRRRGEESDEHDSDEESEEESEEEESEEEGGAPAQQQPELTRAERRELKKKAKSKAQENGEEEAEDEDPILANPNLNVGKKLNISDLSAPRELSRREREAKAAKDAKEKYWKLHEQGKTEQAKADLGRLAKIRAEREAAQAKRKAEAQAKAAEVESKRKEAAGRGKRL
ncbi:unnamed protein product [Somion occarium]|uniref:Casein kinase substrate phosphoprotein PP28 domain-containing protein n=1 Tax=Somion occarium TaxID=3059160 RepID=A0ABP1CR37_9APHY